MMTMYPLFPAELIHCVATAEQPTFGKLIQLLIHIARDHGCSLGAVGEPYLGCDEFDKMFRFACAALLGDAALQAPTLDEASLSRLDLIRSATVGGQVSERAL